MTTTQLEPSLATARLTGLENYRLHRAQSYVEESWANEILFGGAKGGGKSFLIRYLFSVWCASTPGLQCYIFRRTFPDLWKNHMEGPSGFPTMLAKMSNIGECSIVGHDVRWANGARIFLNHLQLEKHVTKYQGAECHCLAFDELTQFSEAQYRYLLGSVRLGSFKPTGPYAHVFPIILSGANPGGVSHAFVKQRFIDSAPPYRIVQRTEKGEAAFRRQFIPSRAEDNPELLRNDPLYLDRLEAMGDAALVKAMREGDWTVVAGAMFGDTWRATKYGRPWHVHPGFSIPASWPLWRGGDDGYAAPTAIYWFTEDPDRKTIYVIDELYQAGMLADEVARKTLERDAGIRVQDGMGADTNVYNTERLRGAYDLAAFTDTGQSDRNGQKQITRGDQMNKMGCRWTPVEKWPGSRVAGVQNFHRLLAPNKHAPILRDVNGDAIVEDGEAMRDRPGIVFFKKCVEAIRTIPALARSKREPEDVDDGGTEDHCFVAGTLVTARNGQMPIEQLQPGDEVLTRLGWAPIMQTWTRQREVMMSITGLVGTSEHKVFDAKTKEWLYLRAWTELNTLCTQTKWCSTELLFDVIQNPNIERIGFIIALLAQIADEADSTSIKRSGVQRMEQYRGDIKSITETVILGTMQSRISNALLQRLIGAGMTHQNAKKCCAGICESLVKRLSVGTGRQKELNGTENMGDLHMHRNRFDNLIAGSAELDLKARKQEAGFASQRVKQNGGASKNVITLQANAQYADVRLQRNDSSRLRRVQGSAQQRSDIATVYNLTIMGAPEYFANGMLVSNCFDGVRYGIQFRRGKAMRFQVGGS